MKTLIDDSETPIKEITLQPVQPISVDEILKGYDKPMEVSASNPADAKTGELNKPPVINMPPVINPQTHYPDGRPIEYFQRGAKRGQPKPYRPIYNNPHQQQPQTQFTVSTPPPATMGGSAVLNGAMFLVLVDLLFPMILEIANNWLDPKNKISARQLKLDDKQKKDIEPIADMVMKQVNINGNPTWLLIMALAGTYGLNFMALKAMQK